jgi:hypothetical protein
MPHLALLSKLILGAVLASVAIIAALGIYVAILIQEWWSE